MMNLTIWTVSTMSESEFLDRWRMDLMWGQPGVQLVDVEHPLEIYVGASDLGAPRMQIRSHMKPQRPELSDVVVVDRQEKDDRWILTLTLSDRHFAEVFLRLTGHLVERSSKTTSEDQAWAAVDAVFDEWRRLLRPRPSGLLGLDALRGLVGELWFLANKLMPTMPAGTALLGWLGPMGAPQDFWYADRGVIETKAIGPSARAIHISSAEQLDMDSMELVVLQVAQVAPNEPGATNLPGLIAKVSSALDAAGVPQDELEIRLKRLGVQVTDDYYSEMNFRVVTIETYTVASGFPAVRASGLAPGVGSVTYAIDRTALSAHLVATETLG